MTASNFTKTAAAAVIAVALFAGLGVRVFALGRVPLGLNQDEACDGYDAYSLLLTGRDQHRHFMPITFQAFNDYRMPLFQYSLVPLVAVFGLKTSVVRLGAAIWGIVDLAAITVLGGLLFGWAGAACAALIGALMPWHFEFSRFGMEATTASATVSLAMASFFLWRRRGRALWLLLSCAFLGLSLYSYSVTKASIPILALLLIALYWRDLSQVRLRTGIAALAIAAAFAFPQGLSIMRSSRQTMLRFNDISLFNPAVVCPNCNRERTKLAVEAIPRFLTANFLSYFTPSFLFEHGDRGDHWTLIHPPGFGALLPEQAPLIGLALLAVFSERRRKTALLLVGWLVIAVLPAAMILPLGARLPEPGKLLPTPNLLIDYQKFSPGALTPAVLLGHPDSRHGILAMAPWIMLSALGFVVLLDLTASAPRLRVALAGLLLAGVLYNSARFFRSYFTDFPGISAPYFQYGIEQVLQTVDSRYAHTLPVVLTSQINQPYIYVLFFERYPPIFYQDDVIIDMLGLFAPILQFDRYAFVRPEWAYSRPGHGIIVFRGIDRTPKPPDVKIPYPDGRLAYQIVVK